MGSGELLKDSAAVGKEELRGKRMIVSHKIASALVREADCLPTDAVRAERIEGSGLHQVEEGQGQEVIRIMKVGRKHRRRYSTLPADNVGIAAEPTLDTRWVQTREPSGLSQAIHADTYQRSVGQVGHGETIVRRLDCAHSEHIDLREQELRI